MKAFTLTLLISAAALGLAGCPEHGVVAEVQLNVDGVQRDYRTTIAEYDQQVPDAPYSVYLLPEEGDDTQPYIGIRFYSGNPVARLFLRYLPPGDEGDELERFECFVPGRLSDGTETLTWTKADGKKRKRQETGDADCHATVTAEDKVLVFEFDANVQPRAADKKKKGKAKAEAEDATTAGTRVPIKGSARLTLR